MTKDEIRAVVLESLREIAPETEPETLADDESLREELDIDSMDFLAFVTAIHDQLGVSIPETDYPQVDSIGGAVSYVASRR